VQKKAGIISSKPGNKALLTGNRFLGLSLTHAGCFAFINA